MTPKLFEAVQSFLIALEADGRADRTATWYGNILRQASDSFGASRVITEIAPTEIRVHLLAIRSRHDSPHTHQGHARALHRFWSWCAREYRIDNPMSNIAWPKQPKPDAPKRAARLEDVTAIYQVTGDDAIGRRDKAIISFILDTACRVATIPALTLAHLDMAGRRAYTVEKGSKARTLHFSQPTAAVLERWLEVRPRVSEAVFTSMTTGRPLTHDGVNQLMRRLARKAGVTGRVNPHSLRHAFAREYIKSGGDLATLAAILGHADASMTADYYAIFTDDELSDKHDSHSPINRVLDNGGDSR